MLNIENKVHTVTDGDIIKLGEVEIKIIDEDGSETPTDEQGTVFMKLGEATKFEYKGDQAKTKKEIQTRHTGRCSGGIL